MRKFRRWVIHSKRGTRGALGDRTVWLVDETRTPCFLTNPMATHAVDPVIHVYSQFLPVQEVSWAGDQRDA